MATVNGKSGTFNIYTENQYISGYVKWQETYDSSTYAETNLTKVTLTAYLHRTNVYSGITYIDDTSISFTRIAYFGSTTKKDTTFPTTSERRIAGSSSTGTATSGGGAFTQVFTSSYDVVHDTNGSKSLTIGFSMSNTSGDDVAGRSFTVPKTTATITLTSIPRASTIKSVSGDTIGSSTTVTLDAKSSSYTHQLWYKVGNSSWYDLGEFSGSSKTFTIDSATANQFTTTSSGIMQLCLRTYNGTTQIGSDVYEDVTVYVPNYTPDSSGITLTGNNLLSGMYVQGKSTVTVNISATTDYGASIVSYSSTIDGKTYSGSSFTTSPLSNGTHKVVATIKDSRGKTLTKESGTITVYPYTSPSISVSVNRDSYTSTTVYVKVKGSVSPINNKNTISVHVTLDGQTEEIETSGYTFDQTITFTGVDTDSTLNAVATVTDSYTTVSNGGVLSTVDVTMDFYRTGKGIAIGKVAEGNGLEVDWETTFNGGIDVGSYSVFRGAVDFDSAIDESVVLNSNYDDSWPPALTFAMDGDNLGTIAMKSDGQLIRRDLSDYSDYTILDTGNVGAYLASAISDNKDVEYGTSGIWNYRKLDNGTAECWCTYTHETAVSKTWGSMYYADSLTPRINYPFTFTDRPIENVTFKGETSAGWLYTEGGGFSLNSTTQSGQYGICRPTSIGSSKLVFDYYVIGKWK